MKERNAERFASHGMSFHPAYRSWIGAKTRCENKLNAGYADYGGRGIKVCAGWATFEAFWQDMGATWVEGLTLDRINVNGDYAPDNCRWATRKQQANNRRNNVIIQTSHGTMTVAEAAARYGLSVSAINSRIRYRWVDVNELEASLPPPRRRAKT